MTAITLTATVVSLTLTLWVLWSNPTRFSNQVFALITILLTLWLACVYRTASIPLMPGRLFEVERWLRTNAMVISFLPTVVWVLNGAIGSQGRRLHTIVRSIPIFALSIYSVYLCHKADFLFFESPLREDTILVRGKSYYIYATIGLGIYAICIAKVYQQIRISEGIKKVELQFLALNAGGTAFFVGALNIIGNILHIRALNRASIVLILAASAITGWALLFHRVFNAREILIAFIQRSTITLSLCAGIYTIWKFINSTLPEPFGLLFSIGLCSTIAVWLDRKSHDWFESGGRKKLDRMRRRSIEIGDCEMQTDKLTARFEELLRTECHTPVAEILFNTGDKFVGTKIAISKNRPGLADVFAQGWATPESLLRRRPKPILRDLQGILAESSLGLLLAIPRGSTSPSFLVALGTKTSTYPFTYPEVERLQNLGELLDTILTRSRLTAQAALQARIEYLAVASRGLAHDLKNLITPMSSFLVHTDGHFPPGSSEGEVHKAARQATRIMSEYVRETLDFSQEMKPRFELVGVERILHVVEEVAEARAVSRNVKIVTTTSAQKPVTADGVLVGRMLANLVANAIDASSPGQTVLLQAAQIEPGWTRFEVIDQGTGISEENLSRIFDPYFTTKGFGDDVRGFGLGLTIAQKIILLHHGKIAVRSHLGNGTCFTVDLPINETTKPAPVSLPMNGPVEILT